MGLVQNEASGKAFDGVGLPIETPASHPVHSGLKEKFLPSLSVIEEDGLVFLPIALFVLVDREVSPGVKKRERRRVAMTKRDDRLKPDFLTRPQVRQRPMARELTAQRRNVRRVRGPCLNDKPTLL